MDRTYYRTASVRASLILLVGIVSITSLFVMHHHSDSDVGRKSPTEAERQTLPVALKQEIEERCRSITRAFQIKDDVRSHVGPCASQTLKCVEDMTNDVLRLVVARHLAGEVLRLDLTNENYHLRWHNIDDAINTMCCAYRCMSVADAPEMERCAFLFDALQHFKECGMVTLGEPPTKPSEMDRYGRGMRWAQMNCKTSVRCVLRSAPGYLNNSEFRSAYPKLSPAGQEYFKKRFREVFGIEYVPDEPGRRAYLWGTKDTLWDGKGLEWRF